jgi:hypothetical protein
MGMGKLKDMFSSKKEDKEEQIPWDTMKNMSLDFKERERELDEKRAQLEIKRAKLVEMGIDVSSIVVEKPEPIDINDYQDSDSIYTLTSVLEKRFQEENNYLNKLDKVYDKALANR